MSTAINDTITEIETRITELQAARKVLLELAGGTVMSPSSEPTRAGKIRARITGKSGTSKLVLEAIAGGADTMAAIAKAAGIKAHVARPAVLALEEAGRVQREGQSSKTRYRVGK